MDITESHKDINNIITIPDNEDNTKTKSQHDNLQQYKPTKLDQETLDRYKGWNEIETSAPHERKRTNIENTMTTDTEYINIQHNKIQQTTKRNTDTTTQVGSDTQLIYDKQHEQDTDKDLSDTRIKSIRNNNKQMYIRDSTQIGNKMKQKYTKETRNIKHANYIKNKRDKEQHIQIQHNKNNSTNKDINEKQQ